MLKSLNKVEYEYLKNINHKYNLKYLNAVEIYVRLEGIQKDKFELKKAESPSF